MAGARHQAATRTSTRDDRAPTRSSAPTVPAATTVPAVGPQAVLRLQAAAGNRSTTTLLAAGGAADIQRRRSPSDVEASRLEEYLQSRDEEEGEPEDKREAIQANYAKSLASGQRLEERGLKWFRHESGATPSVPTSATTAAIRAAGYKTFWFSNDDHTITVSTVRGKKYGSPDQSVGV